MNMIYVDEEESHLIYKIVKDKEEYYFKISRKEEIYKTLLASEIAKSMKIKTQSFKPVRIDGKLGLLSKTYNPLKKKEIKLKEILSIYYDEVIVMHENDYENEYFLELTNNLETIWWALEYYYTRRENKNSIVSSLMQELIDYFILQIVVGDIDLHFENITILDGQEPTLANYYDYDMSYEIDYSNDIEGMFLLEPFPSTNTKKSENAIKDFISYSNQDYILLLKKKINNIPPLEIIWDKIEKEAGIKIPSKVKDKLNKKEYEYLAKIKSIIEEQENKFVL